MASLSFCPRFETNLMSNRKVFELLLQLKSAKVHGKNYIKVKPHLVRHLLRNCRLKGRDAQRQKLLQKPCNSSEIRGVMYRIETFALSCRAMNAVTLGDMKYLPLTSVIAKLYTSYGDMQSCRDTIAVTKLIRRMTRQRILYSTWPRPMCYSYRRSPMLRPVVGAWPEQILAVKRNTKVSLAGALHKWPEYGRSITETWPEHSGSGWAIWKRIHLRRSREQKRIKGTIQSSPQENCSE